MIRRNAVAFMAAFLLVHHQAAAAPAIEPLAGFETGPNPFGTSVVQRAGFYLHADGNFYGTTPAGGAFDGGTLFKMSRSGVFSGTSFLGTYPGQPGNIPFCTPVL